MNLLIKISFVLFTLSHFLTYTDIYDITILIKFIFLSILLLLSFSKIRSYGISVFLLLYIYFLAIITLFSYNITLSISYLFILLSYIIIIHFLLRYNFNLLKIFAYITFILIIISILYTFIDPSSINFRGDNIALYGIFKNNNTFGQVALFCLLTTYLIFSKKKNIDGKTFLLFTIIFIAALFSSSRSVLLAIIFLGLVTFITKKMKYKPLIIIALATLFIVSLERLNSIFMDIFRLDSFHLTNISESRTNLYIYFLNNIDSIPLLGYGIGNQTLIWGGGTSSEIFNLEGFGLHNTFLQVYVETGILGFLFFVIMCIKCISIFFKMNEMNNLYVFIAILISSFFESNIFYITSPMSLLFWYMVVLAFYMRRYKNEDIILAKYD